MKMQRSCVDARTRLARVLRIVPALAAGAAASLAAAPAAGIPFIYNTGVDVFESAEIPEGAFDAAAQILVDRDVVEPERKAEAEEVFQETYGKLKIGYRCSIFGFFYAYLHWWDCKPVFYRWTGDTFEGIPIDLDEYGAQVAKEIDDPDDREFALEMHKVLIAAIEAKAGEKFAEAFPEGAMRMEFWNKSGRWVLGGGLLLLIVGTVVLRQRRKSVEPAAPAGFPPPGSPEPPVQYPPPGTPPMQG